MLIRFFFADRIYYKSDIFVISCMVSPGEAIWDPTASSKIHQDDIPLMPEQVLSHPKHIPAHRTAFKAMKKHSSLFIFMLGHITVDKILIIIDQSVPFYLIWDLYSSVLIRVDVRIL